MKGWEPATMVEQANPTRMNLLVKRAQIQFARQGADLLSRKKDALLREFFGQVAQLGQLRVRLAESLHREMVEAVVGEAAEGKHVFASAASAARAKFRIQLTPRVLWGVRVVDLEHNYPPPAVLMTFGSPRGMTLAVEEVRAGFRRIAGDMLDLAPRELRLRRVGEEVRRTNRKINALRQQVIPQLSAQARYIHQALEQRARDDVIRLKRLKQKRQRQASSGIQKH